MQKPLLQSYERAVASGRLQGDHAQLALAEKLALLARALPQQGALSRLLPKAKPCGIYIHGPVGGGKTMLLDMFFDAVALRKKQRVHFHAFMRDVHERIFRERSQSEGDALSKAAGEIAGQAQLLCLDELTVTDVADAMILSRLFAKLFKVGTVVVSTSNFAPEDLYKDGLNRPLFEPFIKLIRQKMEVILCDAGKDFRLENLSKSGVYFTGADARQKLDAAWAACAQGRSEKSEELHFKGRTLHVPRCIPGVCRFTFAQLCEAPLSSEDYLELAAEFDSLFVEAIPKFHLENRNAMRRFISLIDILYDRGVKLIASAAAQPAALAASMDGYESQAYQRTASRLIEMQQTGYLSRGHLPEPLESKAHSR